MKKLILVITFFLSLTIFKSYAQIDPNFFNLNLINPAFVGSKDKFSVGLERGLNFVRLDDFDFNALEGSPKTFYANVYTPINQSFGVGLSFVNATVGPLKETLLNADISYKIDLQNESSLSLGVKGGVSFLEIGLLSINLPQTAPGVDPLFSDNSKDTNANLGVGLYYNNHKFSAGISVPNFLVRSLNAQGDIITRDKVINYVVSSLYIFEISDRIEFTPAAMVIFPSKGDASYYLAGNFDFKGILGAGVNYSKDNFGILLSSPKIADLIRVGFRIEFPANKFNGMTPDYQNIEFFGNADFNPILN